MWRDLVLPRLDEAAFGKNGIVARASWANWVSTSQRKPASHFHRVPPDSGIWKKYIKHRTCLGFPCSRLKEPQSPASANVVSPKIFLLPLQLKKQTP
jgi:hypothetical protein